MKKEVKVRLDIRFRAKLELMAEYRGRKNNNMIEALIMDGYARCCIADSDLNRKIEELKPKFN